MLPYAQQVLELEKIARLEARGSAPSTSVAELAAPSSDAHCLVCGASNARYCSACRAVCYCTSQHQQIDARWHGAVCEALRQSHEDSAFLRNDASSRQLRRDVSRLETLAGQDFSRSWDQLLGPRPSTSACSARQRVLSDLASRAFTLVSQLRDLELPERAETQGVVRIHVMAASAKELESLALYRLLSNAWPSTTFELALVGPELPNADIESSARMRVSLSSTEYRAASWSALGRPHLVIGFDAGLLLYRSWQATLPELIGAGVPFVISSYRSWEAQAEARLLASLGATPLTPPSPNPFASLSPRRSTTLANDVSQDNSWFTVWR